MIAALAGRPRWIGTRSLAALALALQAWFVVALVALHWLRPELGPVEHRISEYALGPFGGVMTSAFAAVALATLLLVLGLLRDGPKTWPARGAEALLEVAVVGLAVAALFPMDAPGEPASLPGVLHEASLLVHRVSVALAALLLTMGFSLDDRWHAIARRSLLLALALAVEIALVLRSMGAHEPWGMVSRFYALTWILWSSITALRLRAVARS